jgi:predicted NBD/HSP70 family sugar kinase
MSESEIRTGDGEFVRELNRFHVLDCIRRFEPISRTEIVERSGLSRGTVSAIVGELRDEDLVHEAEADERSASRGRPRIALRMNPNAAFVVGVKISMHQLSISVTNLRADPMAALILPIRSKRLGPEIVATILEDGVRAVVAKAGLQLSDIKGLGVGLPGFIDAATGVSHWSPILGPGPVPFAQMIQRRLGPPTVIQNDANLVAMAERWFGHGQDIDDFVVVTLEGGVGMGLYVGGDLRSGSHGLGSELGHTKVALRDGPLCRCGQKGCLEAYVGAYGILREAARHLDLPDDLDELEIDREIHRIAELARNGHEGLMEVFRSAGRVLGLALANVINLLDPAKVIVSGAGIHAVDLIGPALRETAAGGVHSGIGSRCEIIIREWGDDVWARGAASLVLEGLYRAPGARQGPLPQA